LEEEYVRNGKLKYIVMDYPLPFHRNAMKAHVAANCAGQQGKYWPMHDKIFANQRAMKPEQLSEYAENIGLDPSKFNKCFDDDTQQAEIRADIAEGQKIGVRGTPSFGLGYTDPKNSKVKVLRVIRGAQPYTTFKSAIDAMLASPNK
jgi:protein-disulfide isomerase